MRFAAVLAVLMLCACVPGAAKDGANGKAAANMAPPPNPIITADIATTPLAPPPAGASGAPIPTKAAAKAGTTPASEPQPAPEAPNASVPQAAPPKAAPPETAAPELAPPISPEAARCQKSGGTWAAAGKSGAKACVKMTRDAGKLCTKQSQCEGFCLARSGTCAPFTPMFGCNDILQDDGREVSLCLD